MCDVLYSQSHAFKRVQYHQIRIYERSWAQKTDSSKHKKMSGKKRERERVRRISESPAVFVLYTRIRAQWNPIASIHTYECDI